MLCVRTLLTELPKCVLSKNRANGVRSLFVIPDRKYIEVAGKDAKRFLQGIMTNDTQKLRKYGDAIACAFLSSKGRIIADAIVYNMTKLSLQEDQRLLVEVHSSTHVPIIRHLKMHKLRSSVTIKDQNSSYKCYVHQFTPFSPLSTQEILLSCLDPRSADFGTRILTSNSTMLPAKSEREYEKYRILHGIPDTLHLVGRIPIECNLDLLNYISFSKGCYIGQELISRTKFRGILRKRLLPYVTTLSVDPNHMKFQHDTHTALNLDSDEDLGEAKVSESISYHSEGIGLGIFPYSVEETVSVVPRTVKNSGKIEEVITYRPAYFKT